MPVSKFAHYKSEKLNLAYNLNLQMKSFLNFFKQKPAKNEEAHVPETLITEDQIVHNFNKAPAIRAKLEARLKREAKPQALAARQERAAKIRSDLLN